jgi:glucose/arabinose dehydrogenase
MLRLIGALACVAALAGCTQAAPPSPSPRVASPAPGPSGTPSAAPTDTVTLPLRPSGEPRVLETGLDAPWSVVILPSGSAFISERDSGTILERLPQGGTRTLGVLPGVVHQGESGLLGLAVQRLEAPPYLYAYLTTASDNRVVRMALSGVPGSYTMGAPQAVVTGIPKASNHDGGRIAFGPDGMLYITTGDASDPDAAQDLASLGGKILRVRPSGVLPADNPFPGSAVYSLGHRNPQGIAWDEQGTMWASEFGQNTWDELNIITPGTNYGWPVVEGKGGDPRFADPVYEWATDEASPSGIAAVADTIFMAGLGGERLWTIWSTDGQAPVSVASTFVEAYGRLRDVVRHGDRIWILTNNTDGRGSPGRDDDRLLEVDLAPR